MQSEKNGTHDLDLWAGQVKLNLAKPPQIVLRRHDVSLEFEDIC